MPADIATELHLQTLERIQRNRVLAHQVLFAHRHPQATAPFQIEIINAFHGQHPRVVCEAFRGAAKTTYAEETVILAAALHECNNVLLIGASYDRACERIETIKNEIDTNEALGISRLFDKDLLV